MAFQKQRCKKYQIMIRKEDCQKEKYYLSYWQHHENHVHDSCRASPESLAESCNSREKSVAWLIVYFNY